MTQVNICVKLSLIVSNIFFAHVAARTRVRSKQNSPHLTRVTLDVCQVAVSSRAGAQSRLSVGKCRPFCGPPVRVLVGQSATTLTAVSSTQIVGGTIIALALLLQLLTRLNGASLEGRGAALILLYVVGTVTLAIAAVGAYGAHRQSRVALIVFLVCMVIGTLMMLRVGIPLTAVRPEVEGVMSHHFRQLLPLDEADEKTKEIANRVQETMQCCGVFGYDDWRQDIPDSCSCYEAEQLEGRCQVVNYNLMMFQMRKSVFRQPCFPIIVRYVLLSFDVVMGIAFVLAFLALLGLTLSSILIHQLRAGRRPTVMLVPAIFKPAPPKYQELQNAPVY